MKKIKVSFALFPVITFKGSAKNQTPTPRKKFFNNVRKVPVSERTTLPYQSKPVELVA